MLKNLDIRARAKEKGVRIWEITEKLGISDPTMTRKLRHELPQEEKEKFYNLIDEIAKEKTSSMQHNLLL